MSGVGQGVGAGRVVVAQFRVAQKEHPLPRHQDVVEEHHRVHLFEPRPQGMIEAGTVIVEALPAQEFQARSVAGNRKGKRLAPGVVSDQVSPGRVDGDFIGYWPQRGENPAAPDHDARVGLFGHSQRDLLRQVVHRGRTAAPLQVDQRVSESNVVLPDELVVTQHILLELGTILGEIVRGGGPGGERHVQEVRRAGHHPATGPCPAGHHVAPALQVLMGPGYHEGQANLVSGAG